LHHFSSFVSALERAPSLSIKQLQIRTSSTPEACWVQVFDPVSTIWFDLYHYLEQNGALGLVPENASGSRTQVLPGGRVRHHFIPRTF